MILRQLLQQACATVAVRPHNALHRSMALEHCCYRSFCCCGISCSILITVQPEPLAVKEACGDTNVLVLDAWPPKLGPLCMTPLILWLKGLTSTGLLLSWPTGCKRASPPAACWTRACLGLQQHFAQGANMRRYQRSCLLCSSASSAAVASSSVCCMLSSKGTSAVQCLHLVAAMEISSKQ